ncbi:MAG TPA: 2Fe-2S iron-sulfur cluster-binding protein [Solirubrobacteraceae bacterium]|nr:2Fe-2S iron-sulfur cluster-binding protein [Solirubrobacteraceae bacterium]
MSARLPTQPGEIIDRGRPLRFTFDGRTVNALEGDTIGSALYAAGRRTFSRGFKYHRRRGLLCCAGQCPNCLVAVDGAPGVRACTEPAREGMRVEHLNARPGLELDAMELVDLVGRPFTPPGFYYKTFIRPRRLWPLYEKALRHAAGLGRLPEHQGERRWRTEYRRRHADVLVVGAGAAGLSAAIAAAELGADVVLVDEGPEPGGRLLWEGHAARARTLAARARAAGVEVLAAAPALGHFDGLVAVWQGSTLHQVRAHEHVFATGAIEQPLVFPGNDLPGVMLSGAVRRLIARYAIAPGRRAAVIGAGVADVLRAAGVEVVAVADAVLEARGRRHLRSVVLPQGEFACDLLVVSGGEVPATALVTQSGGRTAYDPDRGHFALAELPAHVWAAGQLAGHGTAAECSGQLAGLRAARSLGRGDDGSDTRVADVQALLAREQERWSPPPIRPGTRSFVCLCEDVTVKDIGQAVGEGFDSLELCKRFTTVTMGPCQGRMCQLAAARCVSEATGAPLDQVGSTRARPPWSTVPLGVLAGRPSEPAKRTPLHERHRALGARIAWAGDWRRPYDYGDPEGEALAVHRSAGLIDVSTLGKLLVRGPQAGEFLDRLYPNRVSTLKPGRLRYGVLTSEAGRIMDDGTVARLDEQTFYVTTTSGGVAGVEQWFSWWLTDWQLDVTITDVTQALAAVDLAGPRAREILGGVTSLDCGPEAFAYLDVRQARVAGAPCLLLRVGFVGELSYELHFPAAHGEHVWDAILAAGDVRPFGLEPQRLLRLQKQHLIVGQDTDSESTPFAAGVGWAVKLERAEDFVGKRALRHAAAHPSETVLVGFTVANGRVPTEGAVVLDERGVPVGQVTSARRSRQLDRVIGMAWVPLALAEDGAAVTISDGAARLHGTVVTEPFHDPAGVLMRS